MLIQCAADFHGRAERYSAFLRAYGDIEPDIVFFAGDLGHVKEETLAPIRVPLYAVYGNIDGDLHHLEKKIIFIDGRIVSCRNLSLLGIGRFSSDENKIAPDIVLCHMPPYGIRDRAFFGMHIGSKWLYDFVCRAQPTYVICGHVHEDHGYEQLDRTCIVNCSVGKQGTCAVIDTELNTVSMIGYK